MLSVHLDTALNLFWAAISVAAVTWAVRSERQRRRSSLRGRRQRLLTVCMMTLVIFPTISDTDDLFHFSLLQVPNRAPGGFGSAPLEDRQEKDSLHLARLLETLEHFQVTGFYLFTSTLSCVAIFLSVCLSSFSRSAGCHGGRAPPSV